MNVPEDDIGVTQESRPTHYQLWKSLAVSACVLLLLLAIVPVISYRNTIMPHGIIVHHSAVTTTFDGRPVDFHVLDNFHHQRGFSIFYWGRIYHIGYHYIIFPDGTVQQGRPEHCQGAHAVGHNSDLGICLIGDFSTTDNPRGERGLLEPTEAQMRALIDLCHQLQIRYQIPLESVQRHRDVSNGTECPGDRFPFQELIQKLDEKQVSEVSALPASER